LISLLIYHLPQRLWSIVRFSRSAYIVLTNSFDSNSFHIWLIYIYFSSISLSLHIFDFKYKEYFPYSYSDISLVLSRKVSEEQRVSERTERKRNVLPFLILHIDLRLKKFPSLPSKQSLHTFLTSLLFFVTTLIDRNNSCIESVKNMYRERKKRP
jgi:hypothetical protein